MAENMFEDEFYISNLIASHLRGELTLQEQIELNTWLDGSPQNRTFFNELCNEEQFRSELTAFRSADRNSVWQKSNAKIQLDKIKDIPVRRLSPYLVRLGAAAAILIFVGLGVYFYKSNMESHSEASMYANDIAPGANKAILTLADGRKISLTDAANGNLANQAGIVISKTSDGHLLYTAENAEARDKNAGVVYNTIETPKGGQYQVRLPDGSKVWLNAASSLKYPATFANQSKRNVQLKGEAYFEIAKDKKHPFTVSTDQQEIEVLGTHFNVNSYADEPAVKTTLLEGSVAVRRSGDSQNDVSILKPGQQSVLVNNNIKIKDINVKLAVAWKNNKFLFENDDIAYIMRMVSRWYDVEVVYSGDIPDDKFIGAVSRFENVSEVLKSLEYTGKVKFKIEGRRITVTK